MHRRRQKKNGAYSAKYFPYQKYQQLVITLLSVFGFTLTKSFEVDFPSSFVPVLLFTPQPTEDEWKKKESPQELNFSRFFPTT